jgi:hypothetical protein
MDPFRDPLAAAAQFFPLAPLFLVTAMVAINTLRGRAAPFGRWIYWLSPVVALITLDWRWGAAYLFWGIWEWGRWFDLGTLPDDYNREGRKLTPLERIITAVSFGSDYVAMLWRHAMAVPLLWWIVGPTAAAFPFAVLACYIVGHKVRPKEPITPAEILTGAVWGSFMVLPW